MKNTRGVMEKDRGKMNGVEESTFVWETKKGEEL
jgi:hypothetical protein